MRYGINIWMILLIVGCSYVVSYLLMFACEKLAKHLGAIDYPNEKRRIHKSPTPRMGALGIFISFLLSYMIFGKLSSQMNAILIGSFILVIIGLFDDIKPIPNKIKLLCQLLAAGIAVFYGGFLLKEISAFGIYINFKWVAYPLTIFFIMGAINCINLIDGMDGLSSGICSIYFLTVGIIATILNKLGSLDVLLCFILLGSTLGYLTRNFNPAKIFMGDGGSMFLGYMISIIALIGYKNVTFSSFIVPLTLLAIPIIDTLLAIIRRLLKHQNPMKPDRGHLHFQLLDKSHSVKKSVLIIYGVDLILAAISIFYVIKQNKVAILLYLVVALLLLILIIKTNILVDWKEHKKSLK